ncbi:MAG: hypothetical protein ACK5KU_09395 [Beutenbergiaceae bacterium]
MTHKRYAIFDVDTRQARNGGGWSYMARTQPYSEAIEQLLAAAELNHIPTVATTCVRGNMIDEAPFSRLHPGTAFIPMAEDGDSWMARVNRVHTYFVEKKPRRPGMENNVPYNSWEIFLNNPNANRLIHHLDVQEWIVFGNAMDVCGDLVVQHLHQQGRAVRYVPELMIPGSACKGCDPGAFKQPVFDRWHALGIAPLPLADLLTDLSLPEPQSA